MERVRFIQLGVCILVAMTVGCGGGGGGSSSSQVTAPLAQSFSYSIQGSAIKGVISGATISLIDGDGVVVSGASATSDTDGSYAIEFTTTTQVIEPVQISLSGSGATAVCDVSPTCEYGIDAAGITLVVGFGETYSLPDDFVLRATITSLTTNGDNRSGSAFISPLSDFVTELALDMGSGQDLTAANLDVANVRVIDFIQSVYPTLDVGQLTEISLIPLIDLTDLENSPSDNLTDINLAVTSLSAAVAGFVDAQNSERRTISQVMDEFNAEILLNQQTDGVLLNSDADALLGNETVTVISDAVTRLDNLVEAGTVTLPAATSIANLDILLTGAADALPEITTIWSNLTPGEQTANVQSDAVGRSDLTLIPSTGKVIISVETTGLTAVAAHLHQSYAGTDGPVIVGLEQDPGNPDRWSAPSDATLSEEQIAAVMRGETYINVHTAENQAGEIRGQLVPENVLVLISSPSGKEQVPLPVTTDGFAVAAITLDQGTNIAQVHLTSSLDLAAAHIHSAIAGTNGTIVVPMDLDAATTGHWFATDVDFTELNDELASAGLYFNLHSAEHPGGELRAQIVPISYRVLFSTLDASQAVSAEVVDSTATGVSAMTLNLATGDFSFQVNTTGVEDALAAHIHAADAGINGPVIFPLEQSVLDLNHWSTVNQTFSAEQLTSFLVGDLYVNVHTPANDLGEIRGQLTALAPGFEDTDGDGVINKDDAFPEDPQETTDTDGDGVGDNADACPTDPTETQDSDGDGICDNSDPIDNSVDADGDGVIDSADAFPNDPNESVDSDGDGVGDNSDNCPTDANPGQENSDGVGPGDACEVQSAPSFSQIQAIFNIRCVACHGISGGLSLASTVSHNNLVNTPSSQIPSLDRVEPGDSENSYLIWKIEGRLGIVGQKMPFGGPFLSQDLVDQIRAWIDAGASE